MRNYSNLMKLFKKREIEIILLVYILAIIIIGFVIQPLDELIGGLKDIFTTPGNLITDYMVVGGMGASFVNAGVVALIGYIILVLNKVNFRGLAIAAIFTMMGFAFMGKTIWSILPIIAGVFIYSKVTGREFVTNIYPALFGTALAPLVTTAAFGFGWGVLGGVIIGILVGIVVSPVANHVLTFHEGYNLYNVGFATGFIGLIFLNVLRGYGYETENFLIWGTEFDSFLRIFTLILFGSMLLMGLIIGKEKSKKYFELLKYPGTTITDFINIGGLANTLINMGLVGLIGVIYIELIGANFNGPTICGLFTMAGFAAFGKHPLNVIPIMTGVWLGAFLSNYEIGAPGTILAALFGTALAPIAGRFGPIVGILAGMIHLYVVSTIGIVHGGLNLYNNGFGAGFVAAFFIAIIKGISKD